MMIPIAGMIDTALAASHRLCAFGFGELLLKVGICGETFPLVLCSKSALFSTQEAIKWRQQ